VQVSCVYLKLGQVQVHVIEFFVYLFKKKKYILFLSVATGRPCCVYQRIAISFKEVKQQVLEKLTFSDGSRHDGSTYTHVHPESLISRAKEASPNGLTLIRKKYTCYVN